MTTITFNNGINTEATTKEEILNNVLMASELMRTATSEEEYKNAEMLESYWNNELVK